MEEVKVNPQCALTVLKDVEIEEKPQLKTPPGMSLLRIGIVIADCSAVCPSLKAIGSPASSCTVSSVAVLAPQGKDHARRWLKRSKAVHDPSRVKLFYGEEGFQSMLNSAVVDAVYVFVPPDSQNHYVMASLEHYKHVLLNDPISRSLPEFLEQLDLAKKHQRFTQTSTMFVHQHRVQTFLNCVLYSDFGSIESINAKLMINYDEVERVGATLPLTMRDDCIRRLGRFCVLISVLLLSRVGSRPVSARVISYEITKNNEPVSAKCIVHFSDSRVLSFEVGYCATPSRQVLEVQAHQRYAEMKDFVIPHRDGLATYRIYEKAVDPETGKLVVVKGEALDVMSGPPQDVMMWRTFSELCRTVEQEGYASPQAAFAKELENVAIHTKQVLLALEESWKKKEEVPIVIQDFIAD